MGFTYLLVGFLFLINPVIHVMDLLPDFVGYILIFAGLGKTALFVDHLAEARRQFARLTVVAALKSVSIVFWPMVSDSGMLLLTFVFSLFELLYFIPAVNSLMEGMQFAAMWFPGDAVYAKIVKEPKPSRKPKAPKVIELGSRWKRNTFVFFFVRILCSLLPELTALQLFDYVGTVHAWDRNYSYYKPFLYVFLGLIVIIWGIVWYVRTFRYWNGIRKDTRFNENLRRKYDTDIATDEELFRCIRMKRAGWFYVAAVAASLFCIVDGVNLLIGAVSAVFTIMTAITLGKYVKMAYLSIPFAAVRAILSIWNLTRQNLYFDDYRSPEAVEWITGAYNDYYAMAFTEAVEYIVALVGIVILLTAWMKAIRIHLEASGFQTEHAQYSKQNRDLELYNMAGSRLLLNAALAIVNFIVAAVYHYALVTIPAMGPVTIVVTLVWLAQTIFVVTLMNDSLYQK